MSSVDVRREGEPTVTGLPAATDWGAIFAGAILATAIGLVLLGFGAGLGLSVASPFEGEGLEAPAFAVAAGLWFLWVQLCAFSAGGYAAGRLARRAPGASDHEADVRDGLHGLMVWATGVVIAAVISFAGLGGAATSAQSGPVRQAVDAAAEVVAERAADDVAPADEAASASDAGAASAADERNADAARRLGIIAAFVTAASLLAGAVAAFYAAGEGGKHRDRNTVLRFFTLR